MPNSLKTGGKITGMKRQTNRPRLTPAVDGGNRDAASAVRFLEKHPLGGNARGRKDRPNK